VLGYVVLLRNWIVFHNIQVGQYKLVMLLFVIHVNGSFIIVQTLLVVLNIILSIVLLLFLLGDHRVVGLEVILVQSGLVVVQAFDGVDLHIVIGFLRKLVTP
jgi:hypothetical protein